MNIGEKVKSLRISKLLTQKELSGEMITRNMLSRIENGAALPSLPTLIYLASRLGVPAGYLISDGDEGELYYRKNANYKNLVEAYRSGEWEICRSLCLDCAPFDGDNEIIFFLTESTLRLGILEFEKGSLRRALPLFEEAFDYSQKTVINTASLISLMRPYVHFMEVVSPTFASELADLSLGDEYSCETDFCKYERAFFSDKPYEKDSEHWKNDAYGAHLYARELMKGGEYTIASSLLVTVSEDDTLPRPILYVIYGDFEKCCKETGDYKNAYELSEIKMQLFEKMLAED